jgi:hypothetical protein
MLFTHFPHAYHSLPLCFSLLSLLLVAVIPIRFCGYRSVDVGDLSAYFDTQMRRNFCFAKSKWQIYGFFCLIMVADN